MNRKLILWCLVFGLFCSCRNAEKKYIVKYTSVDNHMEYYVLDSKNDTVLILDTAKYFVCFDVEFEHFLIVAPKGRDGWWAIDINENFLFQVYNTSYGEPSPDELTYGMIRIVDANGKIGYADENGKIVIKPQYEFASSFYKDYAIIGEDCHKIPWKSINTNIKDTCEVICEHFDIECSRYGYIDKKGKVKEFGNLSYKELVDKLNIPNEF